MIAHRGASGHRPEHTGLAYRLAWRQGADSVETDVVSTRDGVLVCRHDLELSRTTDIAERPELAHRRRRVARGGVGGFGWLVQDLDLAELRQLRARERWPVKRPQSARYDGQLPVLTLEELLRLRAAESARAGRRLGVHIELKDPERFASLGTPLHEPLTELLRRFDLDTAGSPATVMSFDASALRRLRAVVDTPQARLFDKGEQVRRSQLDRVAGYAEAVGLHRDLVLPRSGRHVPPTGSPRLGKAAARAGARGLEVLVWTLRSENKHLPADLRIGRRDRDHGDAESDAVRFLDAGVAGLITDFPDVAVRARARRAGQVAL